MKTYRILTRFKGSQHGSDTQDFEAGTVAELSDSLAAIALGEGWAAPFEEIQARELDDDETLEEGELPPEATAEPGEPVNPAELRETKVDGPEETKPARGRKKKA